MENKHRHADLMLQYALDAMETDKPWERWEFKYTRETAFRPLLMGVWGKNCEYRRHPDAPPVPWHLLRKHFEDFCDGHCTWSDHAEGCLRKEPTPKPVDLSVCIESGIDMEFGEGRIGKLLNICKDTSGVYYTSSIKDRQDYRECRPRMNHWNSWQGGDCPVPEGFMGDILLRNGVQSNNKNLCCCQWLHTGYNSDIIAFRVTGLADGYCWPWEDE